MRQIQGKLVLLRVIGEFELPRVQVIGVHLKIAVHLANCKYIRIVYRFLHSAVCDTDHSLVASKVRLAAQKLHHSKSKCRPRINTCNTTNSEGTQEFISCLKTSLADCAQDESIESKWYKIRDAIYNCASSVYGKKEHKNADWFEACWDDVEPAIEAKRQALLTYKKSPNQTLLKALRSARRHAQLTARQCAKQLLAEPMQEHPRCRRHWGCEENTWTNQKSNRSPNFKDRPSESKDWWNDLWLLEYYLELCATQNEVSRYALDSIPTCRSWRSLTCFQQ